LAAQIAEAAGGAGRGNIIQVVNVRADVLSALIGKSRFFIGNNSGPLHIAGALKIPSVSTMGPTDNVRWSPLGPDQVVLRSGPACGPCNRGSCGGHECMRALTAAAVLESVDRLLAARGIARGNEAGGLSAGADNEPVK
jgi:ADP-heptose:LPS heptosyltransferase